MALGKRVAVSLMILGIAILSITSPVFAAEKSKVSITSDQVDFYQYLKNSNASVVFLGKFIDGRPIFNATGFLCEFSDANMGIFLLVTAKHVVYEAGKMIDSDLLVFFNKKGDGGYTFRPLKTIKEKYNVEWIFNKNDEVDIAVIPYHFEREIDDVRMLRSDLFLTADLVHELMDVYFVSYQPGTMFENRISPVLRRGMISRINKDRTFYIDGFAFPGNSGSPVFVKPLLPKQVAKLDGSPIEMDDVLDVLGGRFIGIIGSYIPYQEVAISTQTKRPRIVFEEHSGLSVVTPADCLLDILKSQKFTDQFNKLR